MFFSLESNKNKIKNSLSERIPLTRSLSFQNHKHHNDGRYQVPIHSPPLVLHTPERTHRTTNFKNNNIAMLEISPSNKRSGFLSQQNDRSYDQRDSFEMMVRKPSRGPASNSSSGSQQQLRTTKRADIHVNYRRQRYKSPAPIDDARKPVKEKNDVSAGNGNVTSRTISNGVLDSMNSDMEDDTRANQNKKNKQILAYFSQLSKAKDPNTKVDVKKIDMLLSNGAEIQATDKYGQSVMHEIARNWHPDIAKYTIKKGAELDHGDKYGRTPLHLAAAVGHIDMIEFLVQNKARVGARTKDEKQTPLHYAAKNNAIESMKILIKFGANFNDRDYRARTPLYIAVENGRVEAALYLLKLRAPAAVYDDQGLSCLSIMIQQMPDVTNIALQQFYIEDIAHRKLYCYLNYLENKLTTDDEQNICMRYLARDERNKQRRDMALSSMVSAKEIKKGDLVKSLLEKIVEHNEVRIIVHPAIKLLIEKKWNWCGRSSAVFHLFINIFFALIWSAVCIATPITGVDIYRPFNAWWHIIALEILGVGMTLYFMVSHIMEDQIIKRRFYAYKTWRVKEAERDLRFCHPRWPEEKRHISDCIENANNKRQSRYFSNGWNCFDWFVYALIFIVIVTRVLTLIMEESKLRYYHVRIFSIAQIFIWLRVLRRLRPFPAFGPFIIMLGYVVRDTLKFLVLFLLFFIPYCCAFWIIFRGNSVDGNSPSLYLEHIHDLVYLVFQITVIGEYEWAEMKSKDVVMAQILTGTYMVVVSVICLSLYIALLTNTFSRAYPQAKAKALLVQAAKILFAERSMSKKRKLNMKSYLHEDCAPYVDILPAQEISIATNVTTLGTEDFIKWKQLNENETDNIKTSLKELTLKQEQLMNHFRLILQNMDVEEDLIDDI